MQENFDWLTTIMFFFFYEKNIVTCSRWNENVQLNVAHRNICLHAPLTGCLSLMDITSYPVIILSWSLSWTLFFLTFLMIIAIIMFYNVFRWNNELFRLQTNEPIHERNNKNWMENGMSEKQINRKQKKKREKYYCHDDQQFMLLVTVYLLADEPPIEIL